MDAFDYLSVLLSIVLGFALTEVLRGLTALVHRRREVTVYWPTIAWALFSIVADVQAWWASFGLRDYSRWTFGVFGLVLLDVLMLYLFAALVLPDLSRQGRVDLRAHYFETRRWLFGALAAVLVFSVLKDLALDGRLPSGANLAFHLILLAVAAGGALVRNERFHKALAGLGLALLGVYIALLFSRLT